MNESYPQDGGGVEVYHIYEVSLYVACSLSRGFFALLHFPISRKQLPTLTHSDMVGLSKPCMSLEWNPQATPYLA
jgi:hypothetical protein